MVGSRHLGRFAALAAGVVLLALAARVGGRAVLDPLAYLLPALLLLLAVLGRGYPGERALLRLRSTSRPPHPRSCAPRVSSRALPRVFLPRGGSLIASALAVRPPPAPAGVTHR